MNKKNESRNRMRQFTEQYHQVGVLPLLSQSISYPSPLTYLSCYLHLPEVM